MQISEYFNLGLKQEDLDFVDVNTSRDNELFIDPCWIHIGDDDWSKQASSTISGFFDHILDLYQKGDKKKAKELFGFSKEPNETCFGMSRNNPEGTGASAEMLEKLFDNITSTEMVEAGLIRRLEDIHVFVSDFGKDRLSDLVTNIIRQHLVDYTEKQCELLGIELGKESKDLGYFWNNNTKVWGTCKGRPLIVDDKNILLVPKKIAVKSFRYTVGQYCSTHVLVRRQEQHIKDDTNLVKKTKKKDGTLKIEVFKKDIREEEIKQAGLNEKQYARRVTMENPDLIDNFRTSIIRVLKDPKTTNKLSDQELIELFKEL
ncbi:hypothetical protein [Pseudalkalibacillus salsuginis]|uniref:hypothetical protein n=1 Tax=Pseudalkalibacillus salsuginis TaxID=2910972 RepID=UPI001F42B5C9|nr:hypothetical protein [Pseudalkalibacillus salsuginis]MCF6411502.1 hypothetical protein [Pseudalkalibacillus salsuginis]